MSEWEKVGNIMGPAGPPGAGGGGVFGEAKTTNGTTTVFTTSFAYAAGSLRVYLNGLRLRKPDDYGETSPTSFTMTVPPLSTDVLLIDYSV